MFSCQRSRALLAAESNGLIKRFGKYHSTRPQPKGRAGEARRVPVTVGEGAARRAGNRKGPALEEQARNWAKKKPLKFTRKIRGLSFAFGGAGGFESPAKALDTRAVDLKLALSCHLAFRSGRLAGQLKINHLFYYSMISISNSLEYF